MSWSDPLLQTDLSDIAVRAGSRQEFRRATLERICRALAMDGGALTHTSDGRAFSLDGWGLDLDPIRARLPALVREISPEERNIALKAGSFVSDDVFSEGRRSELSLFRDHLVPSDVFGFCGQPWGNRYGSFCITLWKRGRAARYASAEVQMVARLASMVATGEALHAPRRPLPHSVPEHRSDRARRMRITNAEYQVIELVERGLTNPQIAMVLGRSINTIRNQLVSVFRKVDVCSRTELLFALAGDDQPEQTQQAADSAIDALCTDDPKRRLAG